jgi:hypothetical protein
VAGTHWILGKGDVVRWRGIATMEGAFNSALVAFEDAETGEKRSVEARIAESRTSSTRVIRAGRPLTGSEAQDIADRALAVLGGAQPARWFLTLEADQQLSQASGDTQPAAEMTDLDMVDFETPGSGAEGRGPLTIHVLSRDPEAGTLLVEATDAPIDGRLEMELELENLERG